VLQVRPVEEHSARFGRRAALDKNSSVLPPRPAAAPTRHLMPANHGRRHSEATEKRVTRPCDASITHHRPSRGCGRERCEGHANIPKSSPSARDPQWRLSSESTATLAVCRYEALASAEEFVNEKGELNLPESIAGKTVVGIEDEWIVGGELACHGSRWTYRATEISSAIDWVRLNGWKPTNYIVAEILQAALVSADLVKSKGAPLALTSD
jgi:hypothetical protein